MEFWTFVLFSLVANGYSRRIDKEPVNCPLTCSIGASGYANGKLYTYEYQAQAVSRVSGTADQQTGNVGFRSQVTLRVLGACHFVVNFENVRSPTLSAANTETLRQSLSKYPLHVSWQDGKVEELCSHVQEDATILNIKRGFLSAMQNTFGNVAESYEADVTGNCLTSYSRESGPGATNTVRKSKDLTKCTGERARYHTSILFNNYQADSKRKSLLKSSQECNQTWSEEGVLTSSECSEKHVFRPFSYRSKGAESVVTQTLELLSARDADDTTKFLTEDEIRRTSLGFEEQRSENVESEDGGALTTAMEEMCDLVSPNAPSDLLPAGYLKLVGAMKALNKAGLRGAWDAAVAGSVCSSQQDKIKQMYLDALSMCDTGSCVEVMVELISSHSVQELQKSAWMSSMSFISQPTEAIITAVVPLIQGMESMKAEPYLTLGSLVNRYCRNDPQCERSGAIQEAVAALQLPLGTNCHTSNEMEKRKIVLSLRAIGNAGISTAIPVLNACVSETTNTPDIRLAAMTAFRRLTCLADRSSLKEVLGDQQEDSEMRIAAYSAMMRCPSPDFLRYVVMLMQNEEVNQVGSYIWNHVMEVKSSSDPLKGYLRALFTKSNLSDKFSTDKRKYSSFYENSLYSETLNIGAAADGDLVWSTKSFIPRSARLNLTVDLFGGAFNLFEIGGRVQGIERALERMIGPAAQENSFLATVLGIDKTNARKKREAVTKYDGKLQEIKNKQIDLTKEDETSASVFMRMFGNEMAFEQFGEEITQQAESGSWFGGLKTMLNLATGAEYSMQHSRMLADSRIVVPTIGGFPLTLEVTGVSTMDVSFGGQIDLNKILFQGFHVGGYVKPRGTVEIKASMSTGIGLASKSGIDLQTTLTTSMDVNGTVSLTDGETFRVKIDVPQDRMDVVNFRSQVFVVQDEERTSLMPSAPINAESWCTETGSQLLGIQVCTQSSSPTYSNDADDERPFFPLAGPVHYKFEIRKTDPTLSYYLLETRCNWQSNGVTSIPDEVSARFFIGTPGSKIDRSRELNIMFNSTSDQFNARFSTSTRSMQIQGHKQTDGDEKSAEIVVTIDEDDTYRAGVNTLYEKSRSGGHIWHLHSSVSSPSTRDFPPTISGSLAYTEEKELGGRIEISEVLREPIILRADAEKSTEKGRVSYTGSGRIELPGAGNAEVQMRSSSREGRDRTHLSLNYALFGMEEQTITLSHKYNDQSSEEESQWNIVTDASFSQFPSINHKIQLEHSSSGEQLDSSLAINYGPQYDQKSNTRKFAIKQLLSNLSDEVKTHVEASWSLAVPEYDVNYQATLSHVFDWTTPENKMAALSGSFSNSQESSPLSFDLFASDESTERKTKMEGQLKFSTPWAAVSLLQRLSTIEPGKLLSFGNYALGQASGLQMQMVSNITNLEREVGVSMHLYRPQATAETPRGRTLNHDSSFIQPLPSVQDIFRFSTEWTTSSEWIPQDDFSLTGTLSLKSLWNDKIDLEATASQVTTGTIPDVMVIKRLNVNFNHPTKELLFVGELQNEKSTQNDLFPNTEFFNRNFSVKMYWNDSLQAQKLIEVTGKASRYIPSNGRWDGAENRFEVSFDCQHNDKALTKYIPRDMNFGTTVYARPVVQTPSYEKHHEFGSSVTVSVPSVWGQKPVFLSNEMKIGFTDFSNFDLSRFSQYKAPSSWKLMGVTIPKEVASNCRVYSSPRTGCGLVFNVTIDDDAGLSMGVNVDPTDPTRYSASAKWQQNLSGVADVFAVLPNNVEVEGLAESSDERASVNFNVVVGKADERRDFGVSATFNSDERQVLLRVEQNHPYLLNEIGVPSPLQLNLRMMNRDEQETSTVLEISSGKNVLMTARVVLSEPEDLSADLYSLRFVFQHNTEMQIPSLSEVVLSGHWIPESKYSAAVRMALGSQEAEAEILMEVSENLRLNVNHRQELNYLTGLGFPRKSSIVVLNAPNDGSVEVTCRVDSFKSKMSASATTDRLEAGSIRNRLVVYITHNSAWLKTNMQIPKKIRGNLMMEGTTDLDQPQASSSLAADVSLGDKFVRSNLELVRQKEDGAPVSAEIVVTASHNLMQLSNVGVPEESEIRFNVEKVYNGFRLRMSHQYQDDRKHAEVTIYQRDIMNGNFKGAKLAAELSHNYDYVENVAGVPQTVSATVQVEELGCSVGFWAKGEFEFGAENSIQVTASVNCNGTSTTFAGNSDASGFFVTSYGLPETFRTHVEAYAFNGDKFAGVIGRVSMDENTNDFSAHLSIPELENAQDRYQISMQHTFEELNALYNIPFNVSGTFTGKISPWTYAKGNMEFRIDEAYKFFRFNTGYRFNPEAREYKFDYSMRHNLDFTSASDDGTPPTKVGFGLKMQDGYSLWWDFAMFQERFKGKMGVDISPYKTGFTYNVRHTFATLDRVGIPKALELSATLLAGANNTYGTEFNVEFWRRQFGLTATLMYQPGHQMEVLELDLGARHNFLKLQKFVPLNLRCKTTLSREGSEKKQFSFFSVVDEYQTKFDVSVMIEPESYQNQMRYVVEVRRDPVDFSLFASPDDMSNWPVAVRMSLTQPRDRRRLESTFGLMYPSDNDFHLSLSGGQTSADDQEQDIVFELTNNVPSVRSRGIPDAVHGTANMRAESGETNRRIYSLNFRTSEGKHVDLDLTIRRHSQDRYEISYISSQNFQYLAEELGYPLEMQVSSRLNIAPDQITSRARVMLEQRSHYAQVIIHFPADTSPEGRTQLSRSLQVSHDIPYLQDRLQLPRDVEIVLNFNSKYNPDASSTWIQSVEEIRPSLTINIDQAAALESSVVLSRAGMDLDATLALQHNSAMLDNYKIPRSNRLSAQLQVEDDNQMLEVEWAQEAVAQSVVLRTTNQVIAAGTKRAHREASLGVNHRILALQDVVPNSMKVTARHMIRKILPSFEVGATLWYGHSKFDITTELNEMTGGETQGYALRFGINQDFRGLIQAGVPEMFDIVASLQPTAGSSDGGTAQITVTNNGGEVNSVAVTMAMARQTVNISVEQDFPLLQRMGVPRNVEGSFYYLGVPNSQQLSAKICYESRCVEVTQSFIYVGMENAFVASFIFQHDFAQLSRLDVPTLVSSHVNGHLSPTGISVGVSSIFGENTLNLNSGFNFTLLTGEWNARTEMSHTWQSLKKRFDIPHRFAMGLGMKRTNNERCDLVGDFKVGSKALNARIVSTTSKDGNYGDFSLYQSHNFESLAAMQVPTNLRLGGSYRRNGNEQNVNLETELNRFAVNSTFTLKRPTTGLYEVRVDGNHNVPDAPISDDFSISLTAGAKDDSGYESEIRARRGRKKSSARVTAKKTASSNQAGGFRATLRQDLTSELDQTSVWYQLASSVDLDFNGNVNSENAVVMMRCAVGEQSVELNFQQTRRPDNQWRVTASLGQSVNWIQTTWPQLPANLAVTGDVSGIENGYRGDMQLQYGGLTESVQVEGTYGYNRDTRRTELVVQGNHDVERWMQEYQVPRHVRATVFHNAAKTDNLRSVSAGVLLQLGEKQLHATVQGSLENVANELRPALRLSVDTGHDTEVMLQRFGIPRTLRVSGEITPTPDGLTFETRINQDATENTLSGSIAAELNQDEQTATLTAILNHDMEALKQVTNLPLATRMEISFSAQNKWNKLLASATVTGDDCSFRSATSYELTGSSLKVEFEQSVRNSPLLQAYAPSSMKSIFEVRLEDNSISVAYEQTVDSETRELRATCGFATTFDEQIRLEITLSFAHSLPALSQIGVPSESRVALSYRKENDQQTAGVDLALGDQIARCTFTLQRSDRNVRVSMESEQTVLLNLGVPRDVRGSVNFLLGETSFSTALEYSFQSGVNNRADVTVTWNREPATKRHEVQLQFSHNIRDLSELAVPRENSLMLYVAQPKAQSWTFGLETDLDEKSLQATFNVKFQQSMVVATMRGRHSLPWLTENLAIGRVGKLELKAQMDEDPITYSFVARSTVDGVSRQLVGIQLLAPLISSSGIQLQLNATHDLPVNFANEMQLRVDSSWKKWETSTTSVTYQLGKETFTVVNNAEMGQTNSGYLYSSAVNVKHNMDILAQLNIPVVYSNNMEISFSKPMSFLNMTTTTKATSSDEEKVTTVFLQFLRNDTCVRVDGEVSWELITMPEKIAASLYLHTPSKLEGKLGYGLNLDAYANEGSMEWGLVVDEDSVSDLRMQMIKKTTDQPFNSILLSGTMGRNAENERQELVIALNHTLDNLNFPQANRLCLHLTKADGGATVGFKANFGETSANAQTSCSLLNMNRLQINADFHHNVANWFTGGIATIVCTMQDRNIQFQATLNRDDSPDTLKEVNAEASFAKSEETDGLQNEFTFTFNADHNLNSDLIDVPQTMRASVTVNTMDLNTVSAGGQFFSDNEEKMSLNTGYTLDKTARTLDIHLTCRQAFTESIPRKSEYSFGIDAKNYASDVLFSFRMDRDDIPNQVNAHLSYSVGVPVTNITAKLDHDLDSLELPRVVVASVELVLPSKADLILSLESALTLDEQTWAVKSVLDANVYRVGSNRYPLGRLDLSFAFTTNLNTVTSFPSRVDLSVNITRVGNFIFDSSVAVSVNNGEKMFEASLSNAQSGEQANSIEFQFALNHNLLALEDVPPSIHIQASGKKLDGGFSFSIYSNVNEKRVKLGKMFVQRRFNDATNREEFTLTFDHASQALQDLFVPEHFELNAFKEVSGVDNSVTVYSYDLATSDKSQSSTLTLTPNSFDLVSEHDWVTLSLITGLPYASQISGKAEGSFPYYMYNLTYMGDLRRLETIMQLSKPDESTHNFDLGLNHNMKTWQILGVPKQSLLKMRMVKAENNMDVNASLSLDSKHFSAAASLSREQGQTKVYRADITTKHNTKLSYPENASMRCEVTLSDGAMIDAALTLSLNDDHTAVLRHTGNFQLQDWPQRGSLDATVSFSNDITYLTGAGVPSSVEVATSMERTTARQVTGRTQADLNGDRVFTMVYNKEENSALQLSVDFGSSFVINVKDSAMMEKDGLDFELEFGDESSNKSVFSLRAQPLPILDLELKLDAPSFMPEGYITGPIMVSLLIDEIESENVMAEFRAALGDEAIAISLKDVVYTYENSDKWSLSYVLFVNHNVTLLTEQLALPSSISFNERTVVDSALKQMLTYRLEVRSDGEEKVLFAAEVNKDVESETNLLGKFNFKHSLVSFVDVIPKSAQASIKINAYNDDSFGRVLSLDATYSAVEDQMFNCSVFCGLGNVGTKFGGKLAHRNIRWLAESMPSNNLDNAMEANVEFSAKTGDQDASVAMQRKVKVSGRVGERSLQSQLSAERRETGDEFSTTTLNFNMAHAFQELYTIGITDRLAVNASAVAYADSAKAAAHASWNSLAGVAKQLNGSVQYDGGFPVRAHGSHTLTAHLSHPFSSRVPSQISVTGNLELSDSHIANDWVVRYGVDAQNASVQQRLVASKSGLYRADMSMMLPFAMRGLRSADVSSSLDMQGKVVTLDGRASVNGGTPTTLDGRWTSVDSELTSRRGFNAKMTVQPGSLSQVMPQFNQPAMLEVSAEKTATSGSASFNVTCLGTSAGFSIEGSVTNDNYVDVTINVEQPFKDVVINTWPVGKQSQVNLVIDRTVSGRTIATATMNGDKMDNMLLTVTMKKDFENTMYGMRSVLRRGDNEDNDQVLAVSLDNNTFADEVNFTGEATIQCVSKNLFYQFQTSYAKSTYYRSMYVIAAYDVVARKELGLKWNDNVIMDRAELVVISPFLNPVRSVYERSLDASGTRYRISTDLGSILRIRQSIVIGHDAITLSREYSTENTVGYISIMGRSNADMLFVRLFLEEPTGSLLPQESDVALASLTRPAEGWMQLKLRSRRDALAKIVLDLDVLEGAIMKLLDEVQENVALNEVTNFIDALKPRIERGAAWMKATVRNIQTANLQRGYFSQNEHVGRLLAKLGMPLDQLRTAYYDSFVDRLKEEVQRTTVSMFGATGQTKMGWMLVKYTNEIINHKIDTLDRKLYELVTGSAAPSSRLLYFTDEELLLNFPTVYPSQSFGSTPAANVLRDWLAGTVATRIIRGILGYSMRDQYYRWMAEWNSDTSVPLDPGFAAVINHKQIATFDGKLYDLEVLGCTHLLSQDYLDGNFSLVMQRTPERAASYLLKTKNAEGQEISLQIHSGNMVTVNSQAVNLPYEDADVRISRTHSTIVAAAKRRDVTLTCTTSGITVCQLQLGRFYHGRVSGLMGTLDNEPENDMVDVNGNKLGDPMEEQESWAVASDTNSASCSSLTTSSSTCAVDNDVCVSLFESVDSDLRACFPVVDSRPYLDACRRQLCDEGVACSLAVAYRMKCNKMGAKISTPETCVTCPSASPDQQPSAMETVFVMESGPCFDNLRDTLPRLLRLLSTNDDSRYGLVVYGAEGVNIHTVTDDGLVMGTAHSLEKVLRRVVGSVEGSYGHLGVEALKQAAMYPYTASSKRNVVMLTCSDCQQSKVQVSEVTDLFSMFQINFHLIRNQVVATSKASKDRVVGYDKTGAFTKKSIRGEQPVAVAEQLQKVLVSGTDICQNVLPSVNDGSVWGANEMATRTRSAGKLVTSAVAKRVAGVTPSSTCGSCRCIRLPEGITRQACASC